MTLIGLRFWNPFRGLRYSQKPLSESLNVTTAGASDFGSEGVDAAEGCWSVDSDRTIDGPPTSMNARTHNTAAITSDRRMSPSVATGDISNCMYCLDRSPNQSSTSGPTVVTGTGASRTTRCETLPTTLRSYSSPLVPITIRSASTSAA